MQMVTLVIFLPSLHSIVRGKEEVCSEEVNGLERSGQYWWRTAPGVQRCLYNRSSGAVTESRDKERCLSCPLMQAVLLL